jgi:hypothetical protein
VVDHQLGKLVAVDQDDLGLGEGGNVLFRLLDQEVYRREQICGSMLE